MRLSAAMTTPGFVFPREHDFAPFYTLQPHPATAETQMDMWARMVLSYCAAHKRYVIDVNGPWERASELFCHRTLDRALSSDMIRLILAYLVDKGRAEYDPPWPKHVPALRVGAIPADRRMHAVSAASATEAPAYQAAPGSRALIFWHTPSEWGDKLYEWIRETGQSRSVLTLYELEHGAFCEREQLPRPLLLRAISTLVARHCAQMFGGTDPTEGATDENLGVKFV